MYNIILSVLMQCCAIQYSYGIVLILYFLSNAIKFVTSFCKWGNLISVTWCNWNLKFDTKYWLLRKPTKIYKKVLEHYFYKTFIIYLSGRWKHIEVKKQIFS